MTKLGLRDSFAGWLIKTREISRTELFIWISMFVFLDYTISNIIISNNYNNIVLNIIESVTSDIFIIIGWVVCVWRISLGGVRQIKLSEFIFAVIFCIIAIIAPKQFLPVLMALFALWIWLSDEQNSRAAAAIIFAVSSRLLWSHFIFNTFSTEIVGIDTFFVGKAVVLFVKGAEIHSNIIRVPSGHSIAIMEGCSSFANVSSALLGWVIFSKIDRAAWCRRDIFVVFGAVVFQLFLNVIRIFLMAQSLGYYDFWHNGAGSQIYTAVAAASVVLISVNGSQWAGRGP